LETLSFHVPGAPVAKARPRFDSRSGRVYTPDTTHAYEQSVGIHARAAAARIRWSSAKGETYSVTLRLHFADRRRRDVDNCAKAVLDALIGVAFLDDFQVARLETWRVLAHPRPGVVVTVTRCSEPTE
jgi:Holliday junction resolvase RusA-like endonuclease